MSVFLGRAIACTRLERGMKRKDLAAGSGLSYPFIAEIENGTKVPSGRSLAKLAAVLGVTASALMARGEQIEKDPRNRSTDWSAS